MDFSSFISLEKLDFILARFILCHRNEDCLVPIYFTSAIPSMVSVLVLEYVPVSPCYILISYSNPRPSRERSKALWVTGSTQHGRLSSRHSGIPPWGIHECIFLELHSTFLSYMWLSWLQMSFKSLFRVSLWLYFEVHFKIMSTFSLKSNPSMFMDTW